MHHQLRALALRLLTGTRVEPWLRRAYERIAWGQGARYDRETMAVMRRVLTPTSACADVGCYRGALLEEMVALAPNGRHFAFEPLPSHYDYLRSRFATVQVFNTALADYDGFAVFQHVVGRPARSGLRRVPYPDPSQPVEEIKVTVTGLDRLIPDDIRLDFLKIDVEGAELQVLRGGTRVIRRSRPMVVFEAGYERSEVYGSHPEDLYDFVTDELRLEVSLMRDWLAGGDHLSRHEFCRRLYANIDFCFLAHPPR